MNRRAYALGVAMVVLGNIVVVSLKAYAESVFLASYGAAWLPWLLIANAGGFAVATVGYDVLARGRRARVADAALIAVLGGAAAGAPALLGAGASTIGVVVALAAASQVAGLAMWNRVAASVAGRDARRMLPRAGAAVTAGGVIAGLGAGALAAQAGLDTIPYAGAALSVVALAIGVAQERALATGGSPAAPAAPAAPATPASGPAAGDGAFALTDVQSALVRGLVAIAILEAIVSTVIDLQFNAALKTRYDDATRPVAIALFLAGTNAILFALQAAAVPRILVTRSLPFTASVHPAVVTVGYAMLSAITGFVPIAGVRSADQVLRAATSRTSQELALSALPPGPRARWKVRLRGVAWPAGAGAAALVLLAIGPAALAAPAWLVASAAAIGVVWTVGARATARRFQAALSAPLGIRAERRGDDARWIDLATLERWTAAAGDEDPRRAALARAALATARVDPTALADHLRHDDAAVRAAIFDQLVRSPTPSLAGELRAAAAIEDDDRALALAIDALAALSDDAAVARGERAAVSRTVDDAVRAATLHLRGGDVLGALPALCARAPARAAAIVRARRGELAGDALADCLRGLAGADSDARAGALSVVARAGVVGALDVLADALGDGDAAAIDAIAELDAVGAVALAPHVAGWPIRARLATARALAGAPAAGALVAALLDDRDPEVAHATLRTALAIARGAGSGALPAAAIAAARDAALAALVAHLDARDAVTARADTANDRAGDAASSRQMASELSACARAELAIATSRCAGRLLWACAVAAAADGRDPAPLAATARHLAGAREADRKRALDIAQELEAGRGDILVALERWTQPPRAAAAPTALAALAAHDPWLAELAAGAHAAVEPALVALRRAPLFAAVAGPALAELAGLARAEHITGALFARGDAGDTLHVVVAGSLVARRPRVPDRTIEPGGVVGEVAGLSGTTRAASVDAGPDGADLLALDRASVVAASRRAPELVLGIATSLASWLAPNRPDVL